MSEEKWTPGLWTVSYKNFSHIEAENGAIIARCYGLTNLVNLQANARLVAAAPDLYAELKAVEWVKDSDNYGDRCMYCPCCKNKPDVGHAADCSLNAALKKVRGEG